MRDRNLLIGLSVLTCLLTTSAQALVLSAKSAVIFDAGSGRVLWSKDPLTPRFPASTTKVMTALLLIELCRPEEVITAPPDTETVTGASLHLRPGERVAASELLYGIMLRSANDACHAVAVHIAGSDMAFAKMMNERARKIGCHTTFFHNPHGLNDDKHKISAHDLGLIACEAMTYPEFRTVVKQRKHLMVRSTNQEDRWMINHNKWLWHDKTADGIKTGYTAPAGQCYVGSAFRNGFRVITVVLGSDNWRIDNQAMLDWAFKQYRPKLVLERGTATGSAPVIAGDRKAVGTVLSEPLTILEPKTGRVALNQQVVFDPELKAPIQPGQKAGELVLTDGSGWEKRLPLFATSRVGKATLLGRAHLGGWTTWFCLGAIVTAGMVLRRRARRSKRRYSYVRYR